MEAKELDQLKKDHPMLDKIRVWSKLLLYVVFIFGVIALMLKLQPFYNSMIEITPLLALGGFVFGIITLDRY